MLQHALPLTVLQYRRDRLLVQRVRERLQDPSAGAPHAEDLARALNASLRTLHRHLRQEGASVQSLKDEMRSARAQELLRRARQPIKQVAHQLVLPQRKELRPRLPAVDRQHVQRLAAGYV